MTLRLKTVGLVSLCLLALLAASQPAMAQILYGSIVGNVKDASEAAVAGATITVTHKETNLTRQALTNDVGGYSIPTLPAGTYEVRVGKEGFATFSRTDVLVTINTVTRVDAALKVGAVAETVTVAAEAASLQTDRSEVRHEMTNAIMKHLPIPLGRNYQSLFVTLPGFTPPRNEHSFPSNPSRALVSNANGVTAGTNNVRIDGASSTNIWLPHMTAYVPSLDAIETVNIVANSFDAEQGLAGGAAVNVQIKSGTNAMHGSFGWGHNNDKLKAKNFFIPAGERNPKGILNQFGGSVGGPIKKDKLFYFAAYETSINRIFAFRNVNIPLIPMRSGDLSANANPIYNPLTGNADGTGRTAFDNKRIPDSLIDPIVRKIIPLLPVPRFSDTFTNNYYAADSFKFDRQTLDTKVNWNSTDKFNMYGRFSVLRYSMLAPTVFGDQLGGQELAGGNPGKGWGGTYSTTFAGTYVVNPNFIVDANFGWTRMDTNIEQTRLGEKIGLDLLGIPGTNGPRKFEGGWPQFNVGGFAVMGIANNFMPYYRSDPQYQYVANANWTKRTHNIRWGMDLSRVHLNHTQPEFGGATFGAQGGFGFEGGPTTIPTISPNQYNNWGAFLLGMPTTIGKILQVPDVYHTRTWSHSLYVRDQWQATRKLTLSYGVRWEYFPIPVREDRGIERYDFNQNKILVCGVGVVPRNCGIDISEKLFAPRLGLAYRATDTFVIRAGYGITNDPYNLARPLRTNHPLLLALNIRGPNTFQPAGLLRNGIPAIPTPDLGNGVIDIPSNVAVNTLTENFERGYIQSWNLTLQKQMPWGFVGQAGYVATRQTRQLGTVDYNVGRVGGGEASRPLNQRFRRTAETRVIGPIGSTKYDSLQTSLERRFSGGYHINVAYTWSKTFGVCCGGLITDLVTPSIHLPEYYHLNRAVLTIDRPHNLEVTGIAALPFGKGKPWLSNGGVAARLFGGWQINGLMSSYAGRPFTPGSAGTSLNAPGNAQRADQIVGEVRKTGNAGRGVAFYDPFAYAPVTQARFGTAGFNSLRGPGLVNVDTGLNRSFAIRERWKLDFRAELFNVTNTPHFTEPGANVSNRQLNPDGTIRTLNGFMEITSTANSGREGYDERIFRFSLRMTF